MVLRIIRNKKTCPNQMKLGMRTDNAIVQGYIYIKRNKNYQI